MVEVHRAIGAKDYNRIKVRLKFLNILFVILYLLVFQLFIAGRLKGFAVSLTVNFYIGLSFYLLGFSLLNYIASLPLHFYSSFTLEHKFRLSNQKFFEWVKDEAKGGALSLFIFMLFVNVLYFFVLNFETTWWILMGSLWFVTTAILAKVTPNLIIPLFFKYSPAPGDLEEGVLDLSRKCGIKIIDVFQINFSKKTNKLNAAVVGLGGTRRVILADNLVEKFTEDETRSVLAHEFGHHKLHHMAKLLLAGAVTIAISSYILYAVSNGLVVILGADGVADMRIFPAFMAVLFIFGLITMPVQNAFSRRLEREADLFALRATGSKGAFISTMRKLAETNLSDPNPPKLVKYLFYTHPPISERIRMAENFTK